MGCRVVVEGFKISGRLPNWRHRKAIHGTIRTMTCPVRIQMIDHVVIRVTDLDDMIAFYCDVLGCRVERREDHLGLVQLRAGDALIDLVSVDSPLGRTGGVAPGPEGHNMDHFCLRIEAIGIPELVSWLQHNGIHPEEAVVRYGAQGRGTSIYILDPEGNGVELKPELSTDRLPVAKV